MSDKVRTRSTRAYTGRVINLDVDQVRFPDGSSGEIEIIRHSGASAVVPFLNEPESPDPQVLLLRQFRHAAGGYLLEIPAGRLNPAEEPAVCARRELLEETGCSAERLVPMTSIYTTPGFTDERIHLFFATGLTRGEAHHEQDEFIEILTFSLFRALRMIESGEIRDAKTALGLLLAVRLRRGEGADSSD